ncbi:MAG: hypothetical protein KIS90_09480, partial [Phenylobacterium sp.]|nr:hypothetical protein [Phenylobacterium sp.]
LVLRGDEGVIGVDLLQAALGAALADAGVTPRRRRAFEPHLTLVRDADAAPEVVIAPLAWTAREFLLVHGVAGRPRYDVVARFPLG